MAEQSSGTTEISTNVNHWFLSAFIALIVIGLWWVVWPIVRDINLAQKEIREAERQERRIEHALRQAWYCQVDKDGITTRRVEITHNTTSRLAWSVINPITVTDMVFRFDENAGTWNRRDDRDYGTFSLQPNEVPERSFSGTYTSSEGGTNTSFAVAPDRNDCVYILQHGL